MIISLSINILNYIRKTAICTRCMNFQIFLGNGLGKMVMVPMVPMNGAGANGGNGGMNGNAGGNAGTDRNYFGIPLLFLI